MSVIQLTPQQTKTQKKKVTISLGATPTELKLTPREITLDPSQFQELLWVFDGKHEGELIIQFAPQQNPTAFASPFRGSYFRCPQDGGYLSGSPSASKTRAQGYEYTVILKTSSGVRTGVGIVSVGSSAAGSRPESATKPVSTRKPAKSKKSASRKDGSGGTPSTSKKTPAKKNAAKKATPTKSGAKKSKAAAAAKSSKAAAAAKTDKSRKSSAKKMKSSKTSKSSRKK